MLEILISYIKNEFRSFHVRIHKIYFRMDHRQKIRVKTKELKEKNIGENLDDILFGNKFFAMTPEG